MNFAHVKFINARVQEKFKTELVGKLMNKTAGTPTNPPKKLKMAMVTDYSIDDKGWGTSHYEGLKRVEEELGWEVTYSHRVPETEWETTIRDYAEKKYDLIMLAGGEYSDVTLKVAKDHPNVKFVIIEGSEGKQSTNVAAFCAKNEESAYLAGILAGGMTKVNKIGIVSGFEYPSIIRFIEAFKLGAKTQNPNVKILETYTGTQNDIAKGYDATIAQIDAGVDIIFQYQDMGVYGIIKALRERGKGKIYLIDHTCDQYSLAPEITLTSAIRDFPKIYVLAAKLYQEGKFEGKFERLGLKEGISGIAPYHDLESKIPNELKDKIEKTKQDIIAGRFTVPIIHKRT